MVMINCGATSYVKELLQDAGVSRGSSVWSPMDARTRNSGATDHAAH